jgi:hypothetical protein
MKIWYQNKPYDVIKILRPTKEQTFLVVRPPKAEYVVVLDVMNDEFVIDSPKARTLVERSIRAELRSRSSKNDISEKWLEDIETIRRRKKCA